MRRSVLLLSLLPALAGACINDRDSERMEEGFLTQVRRQMLDAATRLGLVQPERGDQFPLRLRRPEIAQAATGWFDVYPNRYYDERIRRIQKIARPTFRDYDDHAVAYDRKGDHDTALALMAIKEKMNPTGEDRYRLLANRGTFRLERGLRDDSPQDLLAAERDISEAVRMKPGAHFGREATQLELIRWSLRKDGTSLADWLDAHPTLPGKPDHLAGLAGLVTMGAAWEIPVVFEAMATLAERRGFAQEAELARARHRELTSKVRPEVEGGIYGGLRAEAEKRWSLLATTYETKAQNGRHPDTDPTFWGRMQNEPLPGSIHGTVPARPNVPGILAWTTLVGGAGYLVARRRRARRRVRVD